MIVFKEVSLLQKYLGLSGENTQTGFVPTMGALHKGHLSLIEQSIAENDITVVSIYVNPTQFDREEDLKKYPRTLENDLEMLEKAGVDIVFTPDTKELYPEKTESQDFDFGGLDRYMEGAFRSGHFAGVGTVVKRLLEIVKPDNAYFGEKDFQQLQIIRKMVDLEKLPVNIIGCAIYREPDGLAMSSRNMRLTTEQRKEAPKIYQALLAAQKAFPDKTIKAVKELVYKELENNPELKIEYFEIADINTLKPIDTKQKDVKYRGFIAVFAGNVRLIDNIALN